MHITNINGANQNFRGIERYKKLSRLPNLTCACCGKKVINGDAMQKAFASVAKPLKTMVQQGFLEPWKKYAGVWNIIEEFCEKFPQKSLDKIILDNEDEFLKLKTAVAENVLDNLPEESEKRQRKDIKDLYHDILRRSRSNLKGASTVMKQFAVFKPCLSGTKLATFEQLQIYAKKYPRKSLSEIINMDEIRKFHQAKDLLQRAETREKMDYHFSNISDLIKKAKPESLDAFYDIKQEAINIIANEKDSAAKIPLIKDLYKKSLKEHGCEKLESKVIAEVEQLPTTTITVDSFLTYAANHNFTDANILSSILRPSQSSFEHIIPRSAQGEDKVGNGIVMCIECNTGRSSRDYKEFLNYHPMMPYNTQKQIDYITKLILEDRIEGEDLRLWPIRVAKTLKEYTDNRIDLNLKSYCQRALTKSKKAQAERDSRIQILKESMKAKRQKMLELEKELRDLEKGIKQEQKDAACLKSDNLQEKYIQNHFETKLGLTKKK